MHQPNNYIEKSVKKYISEILNIENFWPNFLKFNLNCGKLFKNTEFLKYTYILKHACVYGQAYFCMRVYCKKWELIFNQNYFSSFVKRLY